MKRHAITILSLGLMHAAAAAQLADGASKAAPAVATLDAGSGDGAVGSSDALVPPLVPIDDGVVLPGTPYAIYWGDEAGQPIVLADAGIVPELGEQLVVRLLPDGPLPAGDASLWFRNGDKIVCFGSPGQPEPQAIAFVGDSTLGAGGVMVVALLQPTGADVEAASAGAPGEASRRDGKTRLVGHLSGPGAALALRTTLASQQH